MGPVLYFSLGCSWTLIATRGQLLTADRRREEDTHGCIPAAATAAGCNYATCVHSGQLLMLLIDNMKVLRGWNEAVRGARRSRGSHLLLLFQGEKRVGEPADRSRWKSETKCWEAQTDPQLCGVGLGRGEPGGPAPLSLIATATMHGSLLQPGGLEFKQPT